MCPLTSVGKVLRVFCPVSKFLFRRIFRIKVCGTENIPEYPCIVASNHRSFLDPPVLNCVFKEPLVFLAKEELFRPPFGSILRHMRAVPLKRGAKDIEVLEMTIELLKKGCSVCIFPEGTRARPGEFLKPKPGVGFLAVKSGFPVLPVYIHGTDKVLPRGAKFPIPKEDIRVYIGKPLNFSGRKESIKEYKRVAEEIMSEIRYLAENAEKEGDSCS